MSSILFTGGSKFKIYQYWIKIMYLCVEKCSEHPGIVIQKLKLILLEREEEGLNGEKVSRNLQCYWLYSPAQFAW